jgi:hypothetical protein
MVPHEVSYTPPPLDGTARVVVDRAWLGVVGLLGIIAPSLSRGEILQSVVSDLLGRTLDRSIMGAFG